MPFLYKTRGTYEKDHGGLTKRLFPHAVRKSNLGLRPNRNCIIRLSNRCPSVPRSGRGDDDDRHCVLRDAGAASTQKMDARGRARGLQLDMYGTDGLFAGDPKKLNTRNPLAAGHASRCSWYPRRSWGPPMVLTAASLCADSQAPSEVKDPAIWSASLHCAFSYKERPPASKPYSRHEHGSGVEVEVDSTARRCGRRMP